MKYATTFGVVMFISFLFEDYFHLNLVDGTQIQGDCQYKLYSMSNDYDNA
jgi:hypothetical protein